jgi:Spy/CpxP family protein refolding chaperone
MNNRRMKKTLLAALILVLAMSTLGAQAQTKSKLEQDLEDFRTWMNKRVSQGDSVTRAEWPLIKQEFRAKTQSLERGSSQMTETSKQEYGELKSRYNEWEAEKEERYGQPLNRETAASWERRLAGTNKIGQVKASQLRNTFVRFMENVRAQRSDWSLRDWDYAEHVYLQLSDRKQQVLSQMSNSDKMKVAALQVEFNTLRKSRDAKDRYNHMREQR